MSDRVYCKKHGDESVVEACLACEDQRVQELEAKLARVEAERDYQRAERVEALDLVLEVATERDAALARAEKAEAEWQIQQRIAAEENTRAVAALAQVERLREALTPSGRTKAAFIGEFRFACDEGHEVVVPWTTTKKLMAAILALAATEAKP